ncbi:hypothetical protein [Bacillus altitudinis]|uniref:hypothetical protein n=1 Tax=Bacillus altitudinis TaxID=293387 RepID=UPI0011A1A7E8|nr:hypothetical protein [Bacillus altitudinis]
MTQPIYKTEKRKAHLGERILITDDAYALGLYEKGTVLTVSGVDAKGVKSGEGEFILHVEYEVIIGEHQPAPNLNEMGYDELVALVEDVMKALRTRSYKLGYEQGRFDADIEAVHGTYEKSDQQKRDEIVEKAKEDVEDLGRRHFVSKCDFIVNDAKRTVVALRRSWIDRSILRRGIAKCAPSDCFNVHIGKAIALRRALGFEVPSEYLNVPQPTEVRVGDVVEAVYLNGDILKFTVERIENGRAYMDYVLGDYVRLDAGRFHGYPASDPKTIDDSRTEGDA